MKWDMRSLPPMLILLIIFSGFPKLEEFDLNGYDFENETQYKLLN